MISHWWKIWNGEAIIRKDWNERTDVEIDQYLL